MYHLQKAFENSLRGGNDLSPASLKNKHKTCRGTLHGTGNYQKSSNGKVKSSSVSSEGFSESDSVDSLKEEANKKNSAICDRLHNTLTKASYAKTAKMRYLEDGNDEDVVWIEDLANSKQNKKEATKKLAGGQKSKEEEPGNFVRSSGARNSFSRGSLRKTTPNQNGVSSPAGVKPATPVLNGTRNNFLRSSWRRSTRKKVKGGCLSWEEAWFRANNRKVHCLSGDDKTNCFKDLQVLRVAKAEGETQVRKGNRSELPRSSGRLPVRKKFDLGSFNRPRLFFGSCRLEEGDTRRPCNKKTRATNRLCKGGSRRARTYARLLSAGSCYCERL